MNDYTGWFAGNADMGGDYYGYDGPYPPFNDLRTHAPVAMALVNDNIDEWVPADEPARGNAGARTLPRH